MVEEAIISHKKGSMGRGDRTVLRTRNSVLKEEYVIVKTYEDKLIITVPTIDYSGHQCKTSSVNCKDGFGKVDFNDTVIPKGTYLIDEEESNEDKLVIYLEDKI